ncbi:uncharacterized protein H6S33_011370 [Morchella sextelata]|uniref:uncharacterized protein n=1 Tax=Morchella sextelata TaxID=1174677 RepID=UPI001D047970|nr:uncharacterized protein H6S33_011370 [Morchella sextelata]KAH0610943.1 hypothetical protein H6S33_011370 [Morchella sextelata]
MFPPSCPPACLKRKTSSTHSTSNKRVRLSGVFSPRLIVPTGARRSIWDWTKPPRFILDPVAVQGAKRTLAEDEDIYTPSNCKVRLLDNRDALFLPGYKRLQTKKQRKRSLSTSSPSKKSLEVVRLRRREQFKRQLQRVDSGICMDSDEDLDLDTVVENISPFDGFAFTGVIVDMTEAMEATATTTEGDDMDIEDAIISTDATTTAASSEGVTDSGSVSAEQATSSSKEEDEVKDMVVDEVKDMVVDEVKKEEVEEKKAPKEENEEVKEREEDRDSGIDVELSDAEKDPEQKEVDEQLSPKETPVKEKAPKRLSIEELVTSTKSTVKKEEEEADDEDDEPPRRSTRRRSVKPSILPTTVEEEEEEEKEGGDLANRRPSKSTIKEEDEVESEKETEKEEKKEKKKLSRRKAKVEEADSEASENEDEKKPKKKVVKEEVKEETKEEVKEEVKVEVEEEEKKVEIVETDKMEEDTEEVLRHILEDTDMSTDEDYVPAVEEQIQSIKDSVIVDSHVEEDVTMSEDEDMAEQIIEDISAEQLQNEAKQEVHSQTNKAEESKDIETTDVVVEDSPPQVPTIDVKKTVRRLVLAPTRLDEFEISKMILSAPKTPRTPRSPSISRFNITMSKAPRKLEPILSPRRKKFGKSEDLTPHWTAKRLAAKKRQFLPFNPANISRHAYRDPISDEDHLTTRKSFWEDEDVEDVYVDDQYLRVDWPLKTWGGNWMAENGGALIEFCVRKLEGFNMAW